MRAPLACVRVRCVCVCARQALARAMRIAAEESLAARAMAPGGPTPVVVTLYNDDVLRIDRGCRAAAK